MNDLWDLYLRYDGPVPREKTAVTSPVCWEMMMRSHLRNVRIRRHENDFSKLAELTARIKEIRIHLSAHMR